MGERTKEFNTSKLALWVKTTCFFNIHRNACIYGSFLFLFITQDSVLILSFRSRIFFFKSVEIIFQEI